MNYSPFLKLLLVFVLHCERRAIDERIVLAGRSCTNLPGMSVWICLFSQFSDWGCSAALPCVSPRREEMRKVWSSGRSSLPLRAPTGKWLHSPFPGFKSARPRPAQPRWGPAHLCGPAPHTCAAPPLTPVRPRPSHLCGPAPHTCAAPPLTPVRPRPSHLRGPAPHTCAAPPINAGGSAPLRSLWGMLVPGAAGLALGALRGARGAEKNWAGQVLRAHLVHGQSSGECQGCPACRGAFPADALVTQGGPCAPSAFLLPLCPCPTQQGTKGKCINEKSWVSSCSMLASDLETERGHCTHSRVRGASGETSWLPWDLFSFDPCRQ
ncbi:uncharacterized protein LOC130248574 isoform X1 [Oenanthe melanoleuca]|uniref:uncharacterized protein LOC130248574 isoform X1 n=1 Tax=Oenanthe melanoleuca TaxID=2939378 RepID=UPI0024C20817|nr:uncharacterized protein LOC130248574 isoform X1 [Oenanthe melanoleuca]